MSSNTFTA